MATLDLVRKRISTTLRGSRSNAADERYAWVPHKGVYKDGIIIGTPIGKNPSERWLYMTLPGQQISGSDPEDAKMVGNNLHSALASLYLDPADSITMKLIESEREIHLVWLTWEDEPPEPEGASDQYLQLLRRDIFPRMRYKRRVAYIGVRLNADVNLSFTDIATQTVSSFFGRVEAPDHERFQADEKKVRAALSILKARPMDAVELSKLLTWHTGNEGDEIPLVEARTDQLIVNGKYKYQVAAVTSAQDVMAPGPNSWLTHAFGLGSGIAPDAFSFRGTLLAPETLIKRLSKAHSAARSTWQNTADSKLGEDSEAASQYWGAKDLRETYSLNREPAFENVQIVAARKSDRIGQDGDDSFAHHLQRDFGMQWSPLAGRQDTGLFSMFPCARVSLPAQAEHAVSLSWAAHMGVGDDPSMGDAKGVATGQTSNGKPVYIDHLAAAADVSPPTTIVAGSSGSGKSMWAQWLVYQFHLQGVPGVLINPAMQPMYGLSQMIAANVASLKNAEKASGGLDFFRWAPDPKTAAEYATAYIALILDIDTRSDRDDARAALQTGMQQAANAGVTSVGEAMQYVLKLHPPLTKPFKSLWHSSSLFKLAVGEPGTDYSMIGDAQGGSAWTIVEMDRPLNLQASPFTLEGRLARSTMRLIVESAYESLAARGGGVLLVDEFHVMLKDEQSLAAFDRINRLARKFGVMPIFLSQYPKDFANELGDSDWQPSRKIALGQRERKNAEEALNFIGMEATEDRVNSVLNARYDEDTGRPPYGFMRDIQGRAGQISISPIPEWFIKEASTDPPGVRDSDDDEGQVAS